MPGLWPASIRDADFFNMKLLYLMFQPVFIPGAVCFEEEETSADNLALGKNLYTMNTG